MFSILTIFILIFLPLFPYQIDYRIYWAIILASLFLIPNLLGSLDVTKLIHSRLNIALILFVTSALISTIISIDPVRSLSYSLLLIALVIFFVYSGKLKDESFIKIIWVLVIVSAIFSVVSIFNTLINHYVNHSSEGVSFYWIYSGHNHLSALLLYAIPITFYFLYQNWSRRGLRLFCSIILVILIAALYFSFARVSLISLVAAFYLAILLFGLLKKINLILVLLHLALVLFLILGYSADAKFFNLRKTEINNSARIDYWIAALKIAENNPIFGIGPDTYRISSTKFMPKNIRRSYYAHNYFLQNLADMGYLGLGASLLLIGSLFWYATKNIRANLTSNNFPMLVAIWIGCTASLFNNLLDFDWQLPVVFLIFWLMMGFLVRKTNSA